MAGICALGWPIHLLSWGLSCCGVSSNGLGRFFKSSDSLTLLVHEAAFSPVASFPGNSTKVVQLRALNCLLDDPSALPQEEASVPLLLIQAQPQLLLVS